MKNIMIMKCLYLKVRTFLLFFTITFLAIICAGEECAVAADHKCSGQGTWNTKTQACDCDQRYWGKHCEFGRLRLTSQTGHIIEALGKYHCNSKYMYLIESGRCNVSIKIMLNQFATECNWDHLFIFDGRSIYDPLIASYSGIIKAHDIFEVNDTNIKSVTAKSGAAYLYFYSDALINDLGFNVSYIISNCSNELCHGHGICSSSGTCQCNEGWSGVNCSKRLCCKEIYSLFHGVKRECRVCSNDFQVAPRASHAVAINAHIMYVYGGYSFDKDLHDMGKILKYNLATQSWMGKDGAHLPSRYGHTMVCNGESLFVFGGYKDDIVNELWKYTIKFNTWTQVNKQSEREPIAVYGHASVLVGSSMYSFFGFNKELLYTKNVQKYDLVNDKWYNITTSGAIVNGRFGHSATYDHVKHIVFIFGGYYAKSVDSKLLLFYVQEAKWTMSDALPMPRMLHAAGIIGRNLVIYGGNEHKNDHTGDSSNRCFSSNLIAYNIDGKHGLKVPIQKLFDGKERYGHSTVIFNGSMHIFGGFDGTFKNDVFQIRISGDCFKYKTEMECLRSLIAGCVWNKQKSECISAESIQPESSIKRPEFQEVKSMCKKYANCVDCTNHQCYWYKGKRIAAECVARVVNFNVIMDADSPKKTSDPEECNPIDVETKKCSLNSGCIACSRDPNCTWNVATQKCLRSTIFSTKPNMKCFTDNITSCEDIKKCDSCIQVKHKQCMWCESRNQCFHSNSYKIRNPYGQCLEWISANHHTTHVHDCKAVLCKDQPNCKKCLQVAGCGWCEDNSGTGLGTCMKGSDDKPLGNLTCPANRWSFTQCPACHCNGHSKCIKGTNNCTRCHGNVEGKHCDRCKPGYYGNPENNGTCHKCFCNGHFRSCASDGTCSCNLEGAGGTHCERCEPGFTGDASNGGMCYVNLSVGYEYPRNLSNGKIAMGFRVPPQKKRDKQINFKIERKSGSFRAKLNLSIYYESTGKYTIIKEAYSLGAFSKSFSEKDFSEEFQGEIRAIVYGISEKEFFHFNITVSAPPALFNLIYFLIMFLVCFCSLLIILIVLWKIKQRYDIYIHNRQQRHEYAERISRPFRSISIFLHDNISSYQKVPPSLIVCEQFATGNLAVASVIIELPRAGDGYSPSDHSGICIGSTLVTTPQRWTFTQMQQKYGCDRRRRKNVERAVAV